MRSTIGKAFLFMAFVASVDMPGVSSAAQSFNCPNPSYSTPQTVPNDLVMAVAKTFQVEERVVRDAAFVRCAGPKLMACYIGANLVCDKADTRRALPGAAAWCRENPGAQSIPMGATGHATIYQWSCKGSSAVASKTVLTVDLQGYIAENWEEVR
jgi:hypothetical protein